MTNRILFVVSACIAPFLFPPIAVAPFVLIAAYIAPPAAFAAGLITDAVYLPPHTLPFATLAGLLISFAAFYLRQFLEARVVSL